MTALLSHSTAVSLLRGSGNSCAKLSDGRTSVCPGGARVCGLARDCRCCAFGTWVAKPCADLYAHASQQEGAPPERIPSRRQATRGRTGLVAYTDRHDRDSGIVRKLPTPSAATTARMAPENVRSYKWVTGRVRVIRLNCNPQATAHLSSAGTCPRGNRPATVCEAVTFQTTYRTATYQCASPLLLPERRRRGAAGSAATPGSFQR